MSETRPMVMTKARGWAALLAVSLSLLLAGCAGGHGKRSTAVLHAGAVKQVLSAIEAGLIDGDQASLVALWEPSVRAAYRERIATGLSAGRLASPALSLVGVWVEGETVHAQATWSGRLDGEAAGGQFALVLRGDGALSIVSTSGEVPWAAAQRTDDVGSPLGASVVP